MHSCVKPSVGTLWIRHSDLSVLLAQELWRCLGSQHVPAQGVCCLQVVAATGTSKALSFASDVMVDRTPYLVL